MLEIVDGNLEAEFGCTKACPLGNSHRLLIKANNAGVVDIILDKIMRQPIRRKERVGEVCCCCCSTMSKRTANVRCWVVVRRTDVGWNSIRDED